RLVLTLRFFNDLSYQEIAAHTGQDANTVGVQLLRARQLLKRELLTSADAEAVAPASRGRGVSRAPGAKEVP
ncbi:MAG: RNA polymerase sigma factor, partial [Chloroflexota bacterium]